MTTYLISCGAHAMDRVAIFYTKVYSRPAAPITAAEQPQTPLDLRAALSTMDRHVPDYATRAPLPMSCAKRDTTVMLLAIKDR